MERLSDKQLEELLNTTESEISERKEQFNNTADACRQAVCAFANDLNDTRKPGILFIGAKDNSEPAGLRIDDQLLRSLADMKTDGKIVPLPVLSVERRKLKGAEMAVVTVMPSDMPPVRYEGRIWIRVGSRRALANAQEERILNEKRRHRSSLPFDLQPIPGSTIDDLSRIIFENEYLPASFAEDVLKTNDRSYEERLASCKMIAASDNPTPTLLGLLTIGKVPQDFLPGFYIQFLRIDGSKLTDDILDEEAIGGAVADMIRRTEEKLQAHTTRSFDVTSDTRHRITRPYPMVAIRQVLYNAVLHRTYENTNAPLHVYYFNDRIEISSPGGPYGNVTPENFGTAGIVDYRNPNLAVVLKDLGFIQKFGRCIAIAKTEMQNNGNPEPDFTVNSSRVLCTLRKKP